MKTLPMAVAVVLMVEAVLLLAAAAFLSGMIGTAKMLDFDGRSCLSYGTRWGDADFFMVRCQKSD